MKICVFGLWHLGSVTSACLAKLGHTVLGLDLDKKVVKGLCQGKAPLYEPGLDALIAENIAAGRLTFTWDVSRALKAVEVVWVTLDTPVNDKDVADILFVEKRIRKLMPYLNSGTRVVISSQAPVGFVGRIEKIFQKKYAKTKCFFSSAPENLRLGSALRVFLDPDRIVVGVRDGAAKAAFLPLFTSITPKLEWMKTESAEMTKHAINSFLATSICFANEIALLCERVGAEAQEVARGLKSESRIGPKAYLSPGMAFSGGTLARDIDFLIKTSRRHKLPSPLIKAVNTSNAYHKNWVFEKCRALLGNLKGKSLTILGLVYKPGTDTLRRSPGMELARRLKSAGARVQGYDSKVKRLPSSLSNCIRLETNVQAAVEAADLVILATEWPEFLEFDEAMTRLLKSKFVVDPLGFLAKQLEKENWKYYSVGKGHSQRSQT